ncbi:MAG TPA: hypothetical protein VF710_01285 [Longimicrobium sp.]|jgi:uncharacterized membrane protein
MMPDILVLRARTVRRAVAGLARAEPGTVLLFALLLAMGGYRLWGWMGSARGSRAILAAQIVLLALVHTGRQDARFLNLAGRSPHRTYLLEYITLSLPFWLLGLIAPVPALLAVSAGAPLLLAWLPAGGAQRLVTWSRSRPVQRLPLPARAFEWTSGVRRYGSAIGVVYLAAAALSRYPAVALGGIVLLAWCVSLFYLDGEGHELLEAFQRRPAELLRFKVMQGLALYAVLCLPLVVLFIVRHPPLIAMLALVLAGSAAIVAGAVLTKYAVYREGGRAAVVGPLAVLVLTASLALPPVAAFLLFRFWRIGVHNLGAYLDDLD